VSAHAAVAAPARPPGEPSATTAASSTSFQSFPLNGLSISIRSSIMRACADWIARASQGESWSPRGGGRPPEDGPGCRRPARSPRLAAILTNEQSGNLTQMDNPLIE
jgi:hypothetical protein